ncbi:hypothetical protein FD13_GL000457 [Levilactobacillus senmaizukei DSM 21775 = NBRC 103853]|uniref:MucBP domain-containing protein n=1 Tax=Levilactobacillus senmaizukei DSM 21775 = NBRC 103853 TaxID=1423803 RepID=A0A0R2DDA8_9LACO|nr:DUF5776 domain-containing protein [Levilactobacillus senmaizukei]KRN01870.1 hypothetical protein FD13_GL000457 [Levilactobacillus senmaizukei DSM 21775 = NBRC 103853]
MNHTVKRLTVSGLTLLLLGGLVSPVVASADTTSSAVPTTQAKTAQAEQTYAIKAVEMPYTLMSGKDGDVKVYWFPKWPDTLTAAQAKQTDYLQHLADMYPSISGARDALDNYGQLMIDVSVKPGETFAEFEYRLMQERGELEPGESVESYLQAQESNAYSQAWLISEIGKYLSGSISRDELKASYEKNLRPRMLLVQGGEDQVGQMDQIFAMNDDDFKAMMTVFQQSMISGGFLNDYPKDKLLEIDPDATAQKVRQRLSQPMSDYLMRQPDGSYRMDGALQTGFKTFSSWFENVVTPPDTEKPSPAVSQPVTVRYVDAKGKRLAADKTFNGKLGANYQATAVTIDGYKLIQTPDNAKGQFTGAKQTVTYVYEPDVRSGSAGATVAPKGTVIYATKKIGLYNQATFTKKSRTQWYQKKSRINRPMFVVTGYATSKHGADRYRVKDVNHHSKTAGKTGYVTANSAYTAPVYYGATHSRVTVINPKGINAYSKKSLKGKTSHYKQGQVLKVKQIVSHNLTTRYVLSNGRYITANKQLVKAGKQQSAKSIRVQRGINRYGTGNLTKKNGHYRRGQVVKVSGWTYSNADNFGKGDTLRYQVKGGYVTANSRYVKAMR